MKKGFLSNHSGGRSKQTVRSGLRLPTGFFRKNEEGDPNPPAEPPAETPPATVAFTAEQQAEVDRLLKKVRGEGREAGKTELQKEIDRKKAIEEGGIKTALEEAERERDKLKLKADEADELATSINEMIDGEIAGWDAEVRATDPGKDNVKARQAWVKLQRPLAKIVADAKKAPHTEGGAGGTGGGGEGGRGALESYEASRNFAVPGQQPAK